MALHRGIDGSEPVRQQSVERLGAARDIRPDLRARATTTGTFACPACDAPVVPAGPVSPAHAVACPFCDHAAAGRDFLSLQAPSRPARVQVRMVRQGRAER